MNIISQTIFNGDLADLLSLKFKADLKTNPHRFYHQALLGFMKKDEEFLKIALREEKNDNLKSLIDLRLKILTKKLKSSDLREINYYQAMPCWIKGEAYFVLACSFQFLQDYERASSFYLMSSHCLDDQGFKKKASLAFHNHVAVLSHIEKGKSFIDDFKYCLKYAEERDAVEVQALCLYNLSLAYQMFGAFDTALFYIEAAIDRMDNTYGSDQYYFFRSQQFDLLIKLDKKFEAKSIADELKTASSIYFQKIEKILKDQNIDLDQSHLPHSWQFKLEGGFRSKKLGDLEEKLIKLLSEGIQEKHFLIEELYPEAGEYLSKVNRFNVLLSRLKKKCPNMIVKTKEGYTLSKTSFIA